MAEHVEVSVVVSTYNRAGDLRRLLEALQGQSVTGVLAWELIVVDNNSKDETRSVVEEFIPISDFRIVYAFEGRQGKSFGLNTGLALAQAPVIALTDDDGIPDTEWLQNLIDYFQTHPDADCVGGRVELYNPKDAPITLVRRTEPSVCTLREFSPHEMPVFGCNMALKASAFEHVGPYDVLVGPGASAGTCEDLDMIYRLVKLGHAVHYDPRILVYHNHGRRTPAQIKQVVTGYRLGLGAFYCKYLLLGDVRVLKWFYWDLVHAIRRRWGGGRPVNGSIMLLNDLRLLLGGVFRYLWARGIRALSH